MSLQKLSQRFQDVLSGVAPIEATKTHHRGEYFPDFDSVNQDQFLGWKVRAKNLLATACGRDSEHYRQFSETEKPQSYRDSWEELQQLKHVLLAAQDDYDGGYLENQLRALVQAALFTDELDQARELLKAGYETPAAVVAGVVLETKLRDLCAKAGLAVGKLDKMNADLSKASTYDLLVQKRITALADLRNRAAHGHVGTFTRADVDDMINYVERFLADHP